MFSPGHLPCTSKTHLILLVMMCIDVDREHLPRKVGWIRDQGDHECTSEVGTPNPELC